MHVFGLRKEEEARVPTKNKQINKKLTQAQGEYSDSTKASGLFLREWIVDTCLHYDGQEKCFQEPLLG